MRRPERGARINDGQCRSLIREERENDTFPLPLSKESRQDFLRPYQRIGGNMLKAAWSTDEKYDVA
jgi:hypothetical protein